MALLFVLAIAVITYALLRWLEFNVSVIERGTYDTGWRLKYCDFEICPCGEFQFRDPRTSFPWYLANLWFRYENMYYPSGKDHQGYMYYPVFPFVWVKFYVMRYRGR